uniref:PIN domain-containing protein n=1 Tax=Neobodo designis TaxID=312471 RepID=A0A7S1M701_NEODS|mmetsp:Transcript_35380/g.109143  ORF Transcript_35380/g.109143 Transcript_35380/m.109143 type:complete len:701 (+) Transcript_35380:29-2131(+)
MTTRFGQLVQQFGTNATLRDLRRALPDPHPWAIYDAVASKGIQDTDFDLIMHWTKRVGVLGKASLGQTALEQAARILRDRNRQAASSPAASWQFWCLCESQNALHTGVEFLAETTKTGHIRSPLHYVGLLNTINAHNNVHDAVEAGVELAEFCRRNHVWSSELHDGFVQLRQRSGGIDTRLEEFFSEHLPQLQDETGTIALTATFPALLDRKFRHFGWQLDRTQRSSLAVRESLYEHADVVALEAAAHRRDISTAVKLAGNMRDALIAHVTTGKTTATTAERMHMLQMNREYVSEITPELYHYIIIAMLDHPTLLQRTLERMREAGVQPLPETIVAAIRGLADSPAAQQRCFRMFWRSHQVDDIERARAFWECDVAKLVATANELSRCDFATRVGHEAGAETLIALISSAEAEFLGCHVPFDSIIATDPEAAMATRRVLEKTSETNCVNAIELLEEHCPTLNLSHVGAVRSFQDYVPAGDFAHDPESLRQLCMDACSLERNTRQPTIGLLDASFAEADPDWLHEAMMHCSVLIVPQVTLDELDATSRDGGITADERDTAHQALVAIRGATRSGACRILHVSECFAALSKPGAIDAGTNGIMVAVAQLLESIFESAARVVLCANDQELLDLAAHAALGTLRHQPTSVDPCSGDVVSTIPCTFIENCEPITRAAQRPKAEEKTDITHRRGTPESWLELMDGS